jgi:hypothetical protein
MELCPASKADGLGTGEPGSNVLAAHAGQRRRVLQSHRVGEGGTREGAAMVQRSYPPAMAGAAEHSGHASAVQVGKAKASEGVPGAARHSKWSGRGTVGRAARRWTRGVHGGRELAHGRRVGKTANTWCTAEWQMWDAIWARSGPILDMGPKPKL